MAILLRTHYKLARTAIKENRARSFLTCLGIAIGVASIILILSLTGSISNLIESETKEIGADLIVVRPNSTKDQITNIVEELTSANSFQKSNLATSDIEAIKKVEKAATKEEAMDLVKNANKRIDIAASKGVIKANTRDRYKTRLNKIVNAK